MDKKKPFENDSPPNDEAVALAYDSEDGVPKVIAKGSGYVARKILDTAREENIPVYSDSDLARSLENLDPGDLIPPELYEVIAQVYIFVDKVEGIVKNRDKK